MRRIMRLCQVLGFTFFFFNDTATTEIYTLSLHDALPISLLASPGTPGRVRTGLDVVAAQNFAMFAGHSVGRSEEHTSELQSQSNLVCRLLLEKKKNAISTYDSCFAISFM